MLVICAQELCDSRNWGLLLTTIRSSLLSLNKRSLNEDYLYLFLGGNACWGVLPSLYVFLSPLL